MSRTRARRPFFGPTERDELLSHMGDVRHRANLCGAADGYGSRRHVLCDLLRSAIDALAADLTGDSSYYWDKGHGQSFAAAMMPGKKE